MKHVFLLITCLVLSTSAFSQVGIGIETPDASAALDITSTTQGLLLPRMIRADRDLISVSPPQGLMVYCTNCGANGEAQVFNGTAWVNLVGGVTAAELACGYSVTFTYNGSSVTYGTVIGANSKCWLDRNLGASQPAANSTDAASYGDLYQWGRGADGHELIYRTITPAAPVNLHTAGTSSSTTPGQGIYFLSGSSNWYTGTNPDDLWKEDGTGVNNPCPTGYRIPTGAELDAERVSWSPQNNSTGAWASPLKLPMAGFRKWSDGSLSGVGTLGHYWTSTVTIGSTINSGYFNFAHNAAGMYHVPRANGFSVRCLKD